MGKGPDKTRGNGGKPPAETSEHLKVEGALETAVGKGLHAKSQDPKPKTTGPKPDRLKIDGPWEKAVEQAIKKPPAKPGVVTPQPKPNNPK